MTEFENLKNSYAATIQFALLSNAGYESCKTASETIQKFIEIYLDNSNCPNREALKQELALLKETLSKEIDVCYQSR